VHKAELILSSYDKNWVRLKLNENKVRVLFIKKCRFVSLCICE